MSEPKIAQDIMCETFKESDDALLTLIWFQSLHTQASTTPLCAAPRHTIGDSSLYCGQNSLLLHVTDTQVMQAQQATLLLIKAPYCQQLHCPEGGIPDDEECEC
eukprot:3350131-Amphidinium_carterae.1